MPSDIQLKVINAIHRPLLLQHRDAHQAPDIGEQRPEGRVRYRIEVGQPDVRQGRTQPARLIEFLVLAEAH